MEKQAGIDYTRTHDLTISEVLACPAFAHLTEDQAMEVVETIKIFAKIAYDFHQKNRQVAVK